MFIISRAQRLKRAHESVKQTYNRNSHKYAFVTERIGMNMFRICTTFEKNG